MITLEAKRSQIQEFIENVQTADSYTIGSATMYWIPGPQVWQVEFADGTSESQDNGCGDLLEMIDDADIEAYYEELRKDWFDEEAAEWLLN